MTFIKKLSTSVIFFAVMLGLTACSDKEAEKTGDKVEEIIKDTGGAAKSAGDKISEMKDAAGEKMDEMKEAAGEKMDEIKDVAGEKVGEMKEAAGNKMSELKESLSSKFGGMKKEACEKSKEHTDTKADGC